MSEDKPFPPSPQKLRELRERGIIPYSKLLANAVCYIALALALKFAWHRYGLQFVIWSENIFSIKDIQTSSLSISDIISKQTLNGIIFAAFALIGILLIVSICAISSGLIQTKMFISFALLETKGINSKTSRNPIHLIATSAMLMIFFVISAITFTSSWRESWQNSDKYGDTNEILKISTNDNSNTLSLRQLSNDIKSINEKRIANILQEYRLYWIGVLCFFILTGICSRFITSVTFIHKHGMTRAEIEAELKEDGISDAVKDAMLNLES